MNVWACRQNGHKTKQIIQGPESQNTANVELANVNRPRFSKFGVHQKTNQKTTQNKEKINAEGSQFVRKTDVRINIQTHMNHLLGMPNDDKESRNEA